MPTYANWDEAAKAIAETLREPPAPTDIRDLPENERDAARAALIRKCDTPAPRKPPVWDGRHVRDLSPVEQAHAYAALGIRVPSWR
jgi:hypothetical protein